MYLRKLIVFIGYWLVKGGREAAYELYGIPADNQTATCHAATVVNFSLSTDFKCWQRKYRTFSIWIQPQQTMWNMCLLVCVGYKAVATRDILFKCSAEPLIEVVIIGFRRFICQIEMDWKPHPLRPVIESNSGNSGFALEIPLNHKIQICLATEKDKITELWTLYLLEVIMVKCFPLLCDRERRSRWGQGFALETESLL